MQKSATPIREGVVNLSKNSSMKDLKLLADRLKEGFGIKTLQIHLHEDEGRYEDGKFIQNRHAHMVFSWMDEKTGKSLKLKPQNMTEIQDVVAVALNMERGESSNKIHLDAIQYKRKQEEKKLIIAQEKLAQAEKDTKMAIVDLNKTKIAHKMENTNERIKEAGLNFLTQISGKKDSTINSLQKQVELGSRVIQKLELDKQSLIEELGEQIKENRTLEYKYEKLNSHLEKVERISHNTVLELEKIKAEKERFEKYYNSLLDFKVIIKNLLHKSFIEKDKESQKKIWELTNNWNKQKQNKKGIIKKDRNPGFDMEV
ncbi:MAG: hypothetical protein AB7E36_12050 [Salinivirgaceae bacterium]